MDVISCLKSRRSIRKFKETPLSDDQIRELISLAHWAPSGLNHQPWKVVLVSDLNNRKALAECTHYSQIILSSPHVLAIFLDQSKQYSYVKNVQSIGAFFENFLLALTGKGLGGVWLGEIYNQKDQVHEVLKIDDSNLEFMGAIAFGIPDEQGSSSRKDLDSIILSWM